MDVSAIGDRASLGITTVLTEMFVLQYSSQGMPKASYMKASELYVIVPFGFIVLALLESTLAYKLSFITPKQNKEEKEKQTEKNVKVSICNDLKRSIILEQNWKT